VAQSNCNNPPTPTTDQLSQPITAVKRFTTSQWLQRYSHATNHVTVVHKTVTPQWSTQHVATRCLHTIPNTVSRAQQRLTQLYTQRCTQQSQLESKSAISYSSYGIIDTVNEGAERRHIRQPVTAHARQRQSPPFNHSPHRNQRPHLQLPHKLRARNGSKEITPVQRRNTAVNYARAATRTPTA